MSVTTKAKKPKAKRAVPGETKQDKFVRLAKSRSSKFVDYFELLHNLVDGYTYVVEPKLAKELLGHFQEKFKALEASWMTAISKAEKKSQKDDEDGPQPAGSMQTADESVSS